MDQNIFIVSFIISRSETELFNSIFQGEISVLQSDPFWQTWLYIKKAAGLGPQRLLIKDKQTSKQEKAGQREIY